MDSEKTARRARRRRQRVLAVVVVLAVALVLAYVVAGSSSRRGVERRLEALRAAGLPATGTDLNQPPLPPAEDAAVLYAQVAADVKQLDDEWSRGGYWELWRSPQAPTRAQVAAAGKLLGQYDGVYDVLREAAMRPGCRWPTEFGQGWDTLFPQYAQMRAVVRVLDYRAVYRARRGDGAGAYADVTTALRTARHLREEPVLVGQRVRYACTSIAIASLGRVVEVTPPTPGQVAALWPLLDPAQLEGSMRLALIGERALATTFWQQARTDPRSLIRLTQGGQDPPWYTAALITMGRPLLDHNFAYLLDMYQKLIDLQELSGPAYHAASSKLEQQMSGRSDLFLASMMVPSFARARDATDRTAANLAMARWVLAIARYRSLHGRYPATLAQARALAPGEPGMDPFTGNLPVYKRTAEGYQLYCVGVNGRDDGGLVTERDRGAPAGADDRRWRRPGDQ